MLIFLVVHLQEGLAVDCFVSDADLQLQYLDSSTPLRLFGLVHLHCHWVFAKRHADSAAKSLPCQAACDLQH